MNPYTRAQKIAIEQRKIEILKQLEIEKPLLTGEQLAEHSRQQFINNLNKLGLFFDRLRLMPDGKYCPQGGLNPHIRGLGESECFCRSCRVNDQCTQDFKVLGF